LSNHLITLVVPFKVVYEVGKELLQGIKCLSQTNKLDTKKYILCHAFIRIVICIVISYS